MKRLPTGIGILILIAAATTMGCKTDQEGVRNAAAQQPRYETLIIPDGANVVASLDTRLSTETNKTGDSFAATTTEAIIVGGKTAVAAGARIYGVLHNVQASGRTKGRAQMTLAYHGLVDSEGKEQKRLKAELKSAWIDLDAAFNKPMP